VGPPFGEPSQQARAVGLGTKCPMPRLEDKPDRSDGNDGGWFAGLRIFAGEEDGAEAHEHVSTAYSLKEVLGRGSTSIVYRARRRADRQVVALKVMNRGKKTEQEARDEFDLLQSLRHPNIISASEFIIASGGPVLVMEHFDGLHLLAALRKVRGCQLFEGNARDVFRMLLDAVAYLHKRRIVHGCIKPQEILVSEDLRDLRLVDLGSAFLAEQGKHRGQRKVEPEAEIYMPPEVLFGEPPSTASDMWQVALVLFLMLAGSLPQERDAQGAVQQCRHISMRDPRIRHVSDACKAIMRRSLAVDKNERPQAMEFLQAEWMRPRAQSLSRRSRGEAEGHNPLLPGLEPAARTRAGSARPQSCTRRRDSKEEQRNRVTTSAASTRPSTSSSLKSACSACSVEVPGHLPNSEEQEPRTVEILWPRKELAKVLLVNRLDGTYKVRLNDGSVKIVSAEEIQASPAVEIVRPKREMAKVLLANRVDGTYKVRTSDGSTKVVHAQDVEGEQRKVDSAKQFPSIVEILEPQRERAQVLCANRIDGTCKVRMVDGSVKTINVEEVNILDGD